MRTYTPAEIASNFSALVAAHLVDPNQPAFWVWGKSDRAIISVNPHNVKNIDQVLSPRFVHHLSTVLGGVKVVKTNTRGIFFQVGYTPRPVARLDSLPLDLTQQPTPLHLPIGQTTDGPLWLSISELGSVLIGGTRRMGKTYMVHGWIQSLIYGQQAELILYDGKQGLEFLRYSQEDGVTYTENLLAEMRHLYELISERRQLFQSANATNLAEYNSRVTTEKRQSPIVLIVDEVVTLDQESIEALGRLIAWGGAFGIHPVVATQRTGASEVPSMIKTNMATRISFAVPAVQDSMVILGRPGAEKLPKVQGRLALVWGARLVTAQAYQVTLPGAPQFSGRDLDLARWAAEQHQGRMSIPLLVKEQTMSEREARELLDVWQSRGWLDGGGQGVARRLSPALLTLICQSVEVRQGCQSDGQSVKGVEDSPEGNADKGSYRN